MMVSVVVIVVVIVITTDVAPSDMHFYVAFGERIGAKAERAIMADESKPTGSDQPLCACREDVDGGRYGCRQEWRNEGLLAYRHTLDPE